MIVIVRLWIQSLFLKKNEFLTWCKACKCERKWMRWYLFCIILCSTLYVPIYEFNSFVHLKNLKYSHNRLSVCASAFTLHIVEIVFKCSLVLSLLKSENKRTRAQRQNGNAIKTSTSFTQKAGKIRKTRNANTPFLLNAITWSLLLSLLLPSCRESTCKIFVLFFSGGAAYYCKETQ